MDTFSLTKVKSLFILTLIQRDDGQKKQTLETPYPHWFELAKDKWAKVYQSTGTPCSCWICRKERYNRREYKKETLRIIRESTE